MTQRKYISTSRNSGTRKARSKEEARGNCPQTAFLSTTNLFDIFLLTSFASGARGPVKDVMPRARKVARPPLHLYIVNCSVECVACHDTVIFDNDFGKHLIMESKH